MNNSHHHAGGGAGPPSSTTGTSRSLLEAVRAGDASAWERLVGLYAPLVFRWCRRRDLRDQDSADIFQEVFLAVATHIREFRREQPADTFRGWLHTITTNKIHDHYRRLDREPPGVGGTDANVRLAQLPDPGLLSGGREPPEGVAAGDGAADGGPERELFHRALGLIRAEFEERTWQAFWRTAVEGRPTADVADELAMSPGAVRVAKCRVLQRLREELGDVGG